MGQTITSKSAIINNVAKDDVVGLHGDTSFTFADLLDNDPGGAAKVNLATQFKFGTTQVEWDNQEKYLSDHHITINADGSFEIGVGATDVDYMVQMGNKGTWSQAHVEVHAPAPVPHLGAVLFHEGFEGYVSVPEPEWDTANLAGGPNHWAESGAAAEVVHTNERIQSTDGSYYLDTQASTGGINIAKTFTDNTAAVGGVTAKLSFDLAAQKFDWQGQDYQTNGNNHLIVTIDGVAHTLKVADILAKTDANDDGGYNQMAHFSFDVADTADHQHTISFEDAGDPSYVGFTLDNITVTDWVV